MKLLLLFLSLFTFIFSNDKEVENEMAIPSGYRAITSADIGKTFGNQLEGIVYFDSTKNASPYNNFTRLDLADDSYSSDRVHTYEQEIEGTTFDVYGYYSPSANYELFLWNIAEESGYWENDYLDLNGKHIYAVYDPNYTTIYVKDKNAVYSITFEENGGTAVSDLTDQSNLPDPLPSTTKSGYTFSGWYLNSALTISATAGASLSVNTTLYAEWVINVYNITWNANGGSAVSQTTGVNAFPSPLPTTTKAGSTFAGWWNSALTIQYLAGQTIQGNITAYAKWIANSYTVTWVENGGTPAPDDLSDVAALPATLPEITKTGYELDGWYFNSLFTGASATGGQLITQNETLYAKFVRTSYVIGYELDGGSNNLGNPDEYNVESPTITLLDPSKVGYVFGGWFSDAEMTTAITSIPTGTTGDITIYALFTLSETGYSITWVENGGTPEQTDLTNQNYLPSVLPALYKANYVFKGWYKDEVYTIAAIPSALIGENTTLYAKFEVQATPKKGYIRVEPIDTELSETSKKPLQNKAIYTELNLKVDKVADKSLVLDTEIAHLVALDTQAELDIKFGAKEDAANKGVANGYAPLNASGIVDPIYVPGAYTDYVEYATYANLPASGVEGTLYVVIADETSGGNTSTYRWAGSIYVNVTDKLSASEVKALYESNANTNAYTDDEKTKLYGIEPNAEVNNISDADASELTGGEETDLHKHAAADVNITDTGEYYDSTDVEGVLQEVGSELASIASHIEGDAAQVDDITLVENAYDENTAMFNYRLYGSGSPTPLNGCVLLDYTPVKYDPDVFILIDGIESLGVRWDTRFTVNYYDADKNALPLGQKAPGEFSAYLNKDFDGTLPCSFQVFKPANTTEGIENTEYVRIRVAITSDNTAIDASDCEGLVVKFMKSGAFSANAKGAPSHWKTAVAEKTEIVKSLQESGGKDCVSFAWASDTHMPDNDCGRTNYIGRVMGQILDNCSIPFAVISGDAGTRGALATEAEYLECYEKMTEHLAPLWGTDRLLVSIGNHDGCWGRDETASPKYYRHQFSPERMWSTYFRGQALDFRKVFSENGLYYYVDNIPQKTRFIVLNSQFEGEYSTDASGFAVNNRFAKSCYGQEQLDWLSDVALNMPSGYAAILFTHVPPRPVNGSPAPYTVDYVQFNGIINAYCNKTTYSGSFSDVSGWTSNNISVDFSNAQGEIIAMFAGHVHEDTIDTETLDCPIITVAAGGASANEDNPNYNRPFGTSLETSFDVVTINRATKIIYCTRLGAGSDRTVSYDKTYTITNTLTNCSNSNNATMVTEHSAYNATITANDGYTLNSVAVIMGGADITHTFDDLGTINIYTVTGNIVITAVASLSYTNLAEPNDTNTADWSIWCNDARMGSDGTYRSSTNSMVTNYIPVTRVGNNPAETLYFKNTGIIESGNGVAAGTTISAFNEPTGVTTTSDVYGGTPKGLSDLGIANFTYDANGEITSMTLISMEYDSTRYIRLCLSSAIDKSEVIITKNGPII